MHFRLCSKASCGTFRSLTIALNSVWLDRSSAPKRCNFFRRRWRRVAQRSGAWRPQIWDTSHLAVGLLLGELRIEDLEECKFHSGKAKRVTIAGEELTQ